MLFRSEKEFKSALDYTIKVIVQYNVDAVVLGLPKNMDGSLGEQAELTQQFKSDLEKNTDVKIVFWDERLTSRMASNMMKSQNLKRKKRKQDIDKMAAIIILQGYLDSLG